MCQKTKPAQKIQIVKKRFNKCFLQKAKTQALQFLQYYHMFNASQTHDSPGTTHQLSFNNTILPFNKKIDFLRWHVLSNQTIVFLRESSGMSAH